MIDDLSGGFARNVSQYQDTPSFTSEEKNISDISSRSSIFSDANYVFHFEGKGDIVPSIDNPDLYMNTNVFGTVKMLECCTTVTLSRKVCLCCLVFLLRFGGCANESGPSY